MQTPHIGTPRSMGGFFVIAALLLALVALATVVSLSATGHIDLSGVFTARTSSFPPVAPQASAPADVAAEKPALPPIQPPPAVAVVPTAESESQEEVLPPTATPTASPTPTETPVPVVATATPTASPTPVPVVATQEATPVATPTPQPTVVATPEPEPKSCAPSRNDSLLYAFAEGVAAEINKIRSEQGLSQLRINPQLQRAAENYVVFLYSGQPLADVSGVKYPVHYYDGSPTTRAARCGYDGRVAEVTVISWGRGGPGLPTPDRSARSWLDSPDHKAVLLGQLYEELGVGCYRIDYQEFDDGSVGRVIMCIAELAVPF
jgi:uncharacterized protein YkwD